LLFAKIFLQKVVENQLKLKMDFLHADFFSKRKEKQKRKFFIKGFQPSA